MPTLLARLVHAVFSQPHFGFQWIATQAANSGCIDRLFTLRDGMEYQIADDNGDPGARVDPRQRSGALYGVIPVEKPAARLIGDVPLPSPIVLQYHFTEVKFRNPRIRRLP